MLSTKWILPCLLVTAACGNVRSKPAGGLQAPVEPGTGGEAERVPTIPDAELWTFCFDDRPQAGFCLSIEQAREIHRRRLMRESMARDRIIDLQQGAALSDSRASAAAHDARLSKTLLILIPIVVGVVTLGAGIAAGYGFSVLGRAPQPAAAP